MMDAKAKRRLELDRQAGTFILRVQVPGVQPARYEAGVLKQQSIVLGAVDKGMRDGSIRPQGGSGR